MITFISFFVNISLGFLWNVWSSLVKRTSVIVVGAVVIEALVRSGVCSDVPVLVVSAGVQVLI